MYRLTNTEATGQAMKVYEVERNLMGLAGLEVDNGNARKKTSDILKAQLFR